MRITHLIVALFALLTLCQLTWAQGKEVKPSQIIKGSVLNETLAKNAPEFIATPVALKELWTKWAIAEAMPMVDFSKSIVAVGTTNGSLLNLSVTLDDKGDMKSLAMATMDFLPGFRYVLLVVNREGVKTFNGKKVPTKWQISPISEFKGTVDNPVLHGKVPEFITDATTLQQLWDNWTVAGKMPTVDFTTQVVVVNFAEWVYSYKYYQTITGDIVVEPVITKGNGPGTRYVIAVLNRNGAVSINGKPLLLISSAVFTGSIKDEALLKGTPAFITNNQPLKDLWAKWQIADKMPEIDFAKQLVIISTTDSTGLSAEYILDAQGNVKVQLTINKDFRAEPGFRYYIAVLNKAGVKSIDGVTLTQ